MQQSHTFASHTSQNTDQSLQKSVPAQPKKEFQNIFSYASKKIKTPDTQALTMQTEDTYKHDTGTTEKKHMPITWAWRKWRVQWLIEQLCYNLTLVLGNSEMLRMPPLRQARNR